MKTLFVNSFDEEAEERFPGRYITVTGSSNPLTDAREAVIRARREFPDDYCLVCIMGSEIVTDPQVCKAVQCLVLSFPRRRFSGIR